MPEITPFRALVYNSERFGTDWSRLVAPPYDVLSQADKDELLAQSDHNIVAVDLPHVPPKSAGPDECYTQAAERLRQWQADAALVTDRQPAVYVYHQEYEHAGRRFIRRKFLARMRLESFGSGSVFPHEQTFGGPKEDRLKLMQAARCQLSPVFGLYSDPESAIADLIDVGDRPPDVSAELGGVQNRMWRLHDKETIRSLSEQMRSREVYIADGHHRYGTALLYRDALGELPEDHPARYVLVALCAMEDPGCVILPTHRVLCGFGKVKAGEVLTAVSKGMRMSPAEVDPADVERLPAVQPGADLGIYIAAGNRMYAGSFMQRKILDTLAPDRSPAWRSLDLAYLHRYLIDELITRTVLNGTPPTIRYTKSATEAVQLAREADGIALLCKPCTMDDLRAVSKAGDLMPQKSTYFYPKLATGLVISPLE